MNPKEIKNIINEYFDNELTKAEEVLLFTQLSQDDEAREHFKQLNLLSTATESTFVEYPESLDEKILFKLNRAEPGTLNKTNRNKIFETISYGFAILLLAISFFFYNESMQFRSKLEVTNQQVNQQNQLIQILYNTLPQAEVKAEFANEIIVTPNM